MRTDLSDRVPKPSLMCPLGVVARAPPAMGRAGSGRGKSGVMAAPDAGAPPGTGASLKIANRRFGNKESRENAPSPVRRQSRRPDPVTERRVPAPPQPAAASAVSSQPTKVATSSTGRRVEITEFAGKSGLGKPMATQVMMS